MHFLYIEAEISSPKRVYFHRLQCMLKRIETNICNLKQHVRLHNIFLSWYILIKHLIQGYKVENPACWHFPLQKRYFESLNMFIIYIGCRLFSVAIMDMCYMPLITKKSKEQMCVSLFLVCSITKYCLNNVKIEMAA